MQNNTNMKEEEIISKHLKASNPFRTPDGYFDSFNSRLMQRIAEQPLEVRQAKVVSIHQRRKQFFRYAAAAVLAGLCISAGTYFWNKDSASTEQVAAAESYDYANEDYIDAALDYEMIDNNQIAYYLTEAY